MTNTSRIPLFDVLRGVAIVMMIVFHFNYDLSSFRITAPDFYKNEFWILFRMVIMILIVTLVGISLVLAGTKITQLLFWRRNLKILLAATLVSLGSYLFLPDSFIYFGVLHFIFVASLIGSLVNRAEWAKYNFGFGLFLLLLPQLYKSEYFDSPYINWIGFATRQPVAEDYVPLIPWFGLVLIGLFIGHKVIPHLPAQVKNIDHKILRWLGQNSLIVYLIHQPIMIGLLIIYIKTR